MKQPKIKIRGLCKAFGSKVVLDHLDLDIYDQESLVIIGGSGSGKSVLIKCIIGLITPDKGQLFIDDVDVLRLSWSEREAYMDHFGMLFQGGALFDSLPIWHNVAFGLLQRRHMSKEEAKTIALEKIKAVGMPKDVADLYPAELSGGMQKRISLARAIAYSPDVIFFDEPTTGLDPIMCGVIDDLIVKCVKELGAVGLSITHDLASAKRIADRVAMLYKGKIIWQGTSQALEKSDNPYVDQFVHGRQEGPISVNI